MSFGRAAVPDNLAISGDTCAVALRKRILLVDVKAPDVPVAKLEFPSSRWYVLNRMACVYVPSARIKCCMYDACLLVARIPGMARLEFNPHQENARLLASTCNTEVMIWDTEVGKLLNAWKLHSRPLSRYSVSRNPVHRYYYAFLNPISYFGLCTGNHQYTLVVFRHQCLGIMLE